jgi:hypothetical protein
MYDDPYLDQSFQFDPSLALGQPNAFNDLDAQLWNQAGLPTNGLTNDYTPQGAMTSAGGYPFSPAWSPLDDALWARSGLPNGPAVNPLAAALPASGLPGIPWTNYGGIPPMSVQTPFATPNLGLGAGQPAPNGLAFPDPTAAQLASVQAARQAHAANQAANVQAAGQRNQPRPGMGQLPNLPRLDAQQFRPPADVQRIGAPAAAGAPGAGNAFAEMIARQNAALAQARNAAMADRNRALSSAQGLRNPYDAAYLNRARLQQQDERGRQLAAAEATLVAQYAQMGRVVDPSTLAMLRMKVAQADNADLRNLQLATTGASFAADLSRNDALYRVLAETNYLPQTMDPSLMLQLARAQGIAAA